MPYQLTIAVQVRALIVFREGVSEFDQVTEANVLVMRRKHRVTPNSPRYSMDMRIPFEGNFRSEDEAREWVEEAWREALG